MTTVIDRHRYMASREWRLKRKAVIERTEGWCQRCHSDKIADVHHLTYERLGNELLEDLLGLCQACHEFVSAERDEDPAATAILKQLVNGGMQAFLGHDRVDFDDIFWFDCGPFPSGWYCHISISPVNPKASSASSARPDIVVTIPQFGIWLQCQWF